MKFPWSNIGRIRGNPETIQPTVEIPNESARYSFWKSKGFNPKVIYDIGANHGLWTKNMRSVFSDSKYYLFEGCDETAQYNTEENYYTVLLGNTEDVVDFYCISPGNCNTGNSIYRELTNGFENVKGTKTQLRRLDSYVLENNIPYPDFIKIDVQGAELDVLKGARECLNRATMIHLEVSLHRYNLGAPLFGEVVSYMNSNGFEGIDIVEYHHLKGYLIQVDILFAKTGSGYRLDTFMS